VKRAAVLLAAVAVSLGACSPSADSPIEPSLDLNPNPGGIAWVTTNADAGPGSFRDAIALANGDASVRKVSFHPSLGPVSLQQGVAFTGAQELTIQGHGATLDGSGLATAEGALLVSGGGDLTIEGLTVRNAPGIGITVKIPASETGQVRITLTDLHVLDNGLHGVLINDQAEYFNDPNSTSDAGSNAGLLVMVRRSSFERNGLTVIDQDGLRVNEGGVGDLEVSIQGTRVVGNGGDGIEFDERAGGSAVFTVRNTALLFNGPFSATDFDDGIDVDEAGDGDIRGSFVDVSANDNFEQGVDLNENDAGDMKITMFGVEALRNRQEGIEFEEDDDFAGGGNIEALLEDIVTDGNLGGDAGLKLREKGAGNVIATLRNVEASGNTVGGILVREDGSGDQTTVVINARTFGNALDGIKFDENSSGNLDAEVVNAVSSDNTGAGVAAEQALPGTGLLKIKALTATGNAAGAVKNDAGVVVQVLP
jgi:hypothetical protein